MKLGWDDLLIQNVTPELAASGLKLWTPLLPQRRHRVVFLNRLGEWFLQTDDMQYCRVSVLSGTTDFVAAGDQEFGALVNNEDWQIVNLWSLRVLEWKQQGLNPGPEQVFAPIPHPALFKGELSSQAMVMDLIVWQGVAAQTLGFS